MVREVDDEDLNLSDKYEEDKEFDSALDYLGVDKKELEDSAFVNFKVDKEVSKKVTKLTQLPMSFRMALEGKSYDEEKGGFRQTGKSIAGQRIISKMTGIINSFASEANLITQKNIDTFIMQYADAGFKILGELLRDRSVSENNTRVIWKMFKDNLFNIGEIITGSKENMARVFGKIEQDRNENKELMNF